MEFRPLLADSMILVALPTPDAQVFFLYFSIQWGRALVFSLLLLLSTIQYWIGCMDAERLSQTRRRFHICHNNGHGHADAHVDAQRTTPGCSYFVSCICTCVFVDYQAGTQRCLGFVYFRFGPSARENVMLGLTLSRNHATFSLASAAFHSLSSRLSPTDPFAPLLCLLLLNIGGHHWWLPQQR